MQISQLHNATEEKLNKKLNNTMQYHICTVSIKTMNGIDDACGRNIPDSDEWEIINKKPINKSPGRGRLGEVGWDEGDKNWWTQSE